MYWWHFHDLIVKITQSDGTDSLLVQATIFGPIIGAVIAGGITLFVEWNKERKGRYRRHIDALVHLETLLNEHLDQISISRTVIANEKIALLKKGFTGRRISSFIIDPSIIPDLAVLSFINRYFSYMRYITRVNADFEAFNRVIERMESVVISGQVLLGQNFITLAENLSAFDEVLDKLDQQIISLLVSVRIYLTKARKVYNFWYPLLNKNWSLPITEDEIRIETEKLKAEMASAGSR